MNPYITLFTMILLSSSLAGCANYTTSVNPPKYQSQINKISRFHNKYYICEDNDYLWGNGGKYLAKPGQSCSGWTMGIMPSYGEYYKNPKKWRQWIQLFDRRYRIIGIVDQNTIYRLNRVVIKYEAAYEEITIENGALKGTKVTCDATSGFGKSGEAYGYKINFYF